MLQVYKYEQGKLTLVTDNKTLPKYLCCVQTGQFFMLTTKDVYREMQYKVSGKEDRYRCARLMKKLIEGVRVNNSLDGSGKREVAKTEMGVVKATMYRLKPSGLMVPYMDSDSRLEFIKKVARAVQ